LVPAVSHARSTILPERSVASVSRWCPRPGYSRFWARFLSDRTHTLPSPSGLRVPSSSPPCKVVVRRRIECAAWLSIVGRRIASLSTTCKNLEGKDTDTRTVSPVDRFSGIASLAGNLPPRGARGRNSLGVETRSTRFRAPSGESPLAGSSTRSDRGFRARDVERPEPRSEQRREGHERLSAATTARRVREDRPSERDDAPPLTTGSRWEQGASPDPSAAVGSGCCGGTVRRGVPTRPTGAIPFAWMRFPTPEERGSPLPGRFPHRQHPETRTSSYISSCARGTR
jgi:hypothetical protein